MKFVIKEKTTAIENFYLNSGRFFCVCFVNPLLDQSGIHDFVVAVVLHIRLVLTFLCQCVEL